MMTDEDLRKLNNLMAEKGKEWAAVIQIKIEREIFDSLFGAPPNPDEQSFAE